MIGGPRPTYSGGRLEGKGPRGPIPKLQKARGNEYGILTQMSAFIASNAVQFFYGCLASYAIEAIIIYFELH